ncbi:MAG: iron transporter [Acidobacteria bacterium]|nr:iron transporter [Acidobacteriota bacterium]
MTGLLAHACFMFALFSAVALAVPFSALAKEVPIGTPRELGGIRVAAVYSEPVPMDEYWGGPPPEEADIHLEADIHAIKGNRNGFGAGEWIPYLSVNYSLELLGTGKTRSGQLWQMMASDGPHYGINIKMLGHGSYRLTYRIGSPAEWGLARHTDRKTGVDPWWEPFEVEWTFEFPAKGKGR